MNLTKEQIEALYKQRDADFAALSLLDVIEQGDLLGADKAVRSRVADELWGKCSVVVRNNLLNDGHHWVRSSALISNSKFHSVSNPTLVSR